MSTVTIENTGKRWKGLQAVGVLGMIFGLLLMFVAHGLGATIAGLGLAAFVVARIGAWWHHG